MARHLKRKKGGDGTMRKLDILVLSVILSFLFLSSGNNTAFAEAEVKKWTVEETIQKVRDAGFHEALYNYGNLFIETRLNPDARPEMYRIQARFYE
jgi:hypothetical protein